MRVARDNRHLPRRDGRSVPRPSPKLPAASERPLGACASADCASRRSPAPCSRCSRSGSAAGRKAMRARSATRFDTAGRDDRRRRTRCDDSAVVLGACRGPRKPGETKTRQRAAFGPFVCVPAARSGRRGCSCAPETRGFACGGFVSADRCAWAHCLRSALMKPRPVYEAGARGSTRRGSAPEK